MGVNLDSRYQVEAYDAIQHSIKETGKAGVVLPTGTGKTYLALKLIEDNLDKNKILYVSPSPTINVQVRKIIKEIYPKQKADEILSKLKFVTYSGLDKRFKHDKLDMQEYSADVIILDEVHRSGAEDWGKAVDYLLEINSSAQVLGMTATPLRSDGQNMIEKRFGDVAYELKLSEAVARGILTLPIYISSRYIFEEDIQSLQEKIDSIDDESKKKEFQEKLDKAKKSVETAGGIKEILGKHMKDGKWLVFCNPGDDIEELQTQAIQEGWFDEINKNQTFLRVESTRTDSENDMALRIFERKGGIDLRILYSKNMLNEGIHDDKITGEIMLRPTKSYILFIQQLGRILSKNRAETPIVLDLVGNIKYFKEFRLEIQEIIRQGIARGDTRYSKKILEQFRILEEQEDFIQSFEEIETSIEEYMSKTSIEETLDILEALKNEGINVAEIKKFITENGKQRSSFLYEIQDKNIVEIIEKFKFDRNYPIGRKINYMIQVYKGIVKRNITESNKRRIENLGIIREEKSAIEEILDILEILKFEGIDVTKITRSIKKDGKERSTYLCEINDENIEEIIEKLGLDREYPIGGRISQVIKAYRGKNRMRITQYDRKRIESMGFIKEEKSSITETIEILEILKSEGIDLEKDIQQTKTKKRKTRGTLLYEVNNENIEAIIRKYNLNREFPVGDKMYYMLKVYRGTKSRKITNAERERIEKLGLIGEKSVLQEILDILESLKAEGIDITRIQQYIQEDGKQRSTYLYEIKEESIEEIIQKLGLDREYPIGAKIGAILRVYKGTARWNITEEDKARIEALGVLKEKSATEETLDILESLNAAGIQVIEAKKSIRIGSGRESKYRRRLLYELEQESIEEVIEKLGLEREYPIGAKVASMLQAYRGTGTR